jgi:hypothetical protein
VWRLQLSKWYFIQPSPRTFHHGNATLFHDAPVCRGYDPGGVRPEQGSTLGPFEEHQAGHARQDNTTKPLANPQTFDEAKALQLLPATSLRITVPKVLLNVEASLTGCWRTDPHGDWDAYRGGFLFRSMICQRLDQISYRMIPGADSYHRLCLVGHPLPPRRGQLQRLAARPRTPVPSFYQSDLCDYLDLFSPFLCQRVNLDPDWMTWWQLNELYRERESLSGIEDLRFKNAVYS